MPVEHAEMRSRGLCRQRFWGDCRQPAPRRQRGARRRRHIRSVAHRVASKLRRSRFL